MTASTTAASAPGPWSPLKHPAFRMLWFAQVGTNIGDWMQTVGAQWILVEHGASLVALVQTASLGPMLLLSPIAGVLADTFDRRRLLYLTMGAMAVTMAALATVTAVTDIAPALLLVFTALIGCGAAVTSPAWQAIQPELVDREEIPAAAALGSVAVNAARAVGPAIAGFLVASVGPAAVFGINAVSFVGVAAAVVAWHRAPTDHRDAERLGPALATGFRYVRSAYGVRRLMLRAAMFAVPASALWAVLPVVASDRLRLGSGGYGVLLAMLGVGAVVGVWLLPRLRSRFSSNVILAGSAVGFAVGAVACAFVSYAVLCPLLIVAGVAWIGTLSTLNGLVQMTLPGWVRARGMSYYLLVFMGSQALAALAWGFVADAIGLRTTLTVSAALLVAVALSVVVLPVHPGTGDLDRTPVSMSADPVVLFDAEPTDGPVQVSVEYRIPPGVTDEFVAAMTKVRQSRRRTGASRWRLYRDPAETGRFVEVFVLPSWGDHVRQHEERWTGFDQELLDRVRALTDGTEPVVQHLIAASSRH